MPSEKHNLHLFGYQGMNSINLPTKLFTMMRIMVANIYRALAI